MKKVMKKKASSSMKRKGMMMKGMKGKMAC